MRDPLGELKEALRRGAPPPEAATAKLPEEPSAFYAVGRFLLSWTEAGELGADQAVLLRQALRWLGGAPLFVGLAAKTEEFIHTLARAGVAWAPDGVLHLHNFAAPWWPEPADCDAPPRKRAPDESFPGEAWLRSIAYARWRSQAQKEAAWATLQAPPGSTRVVVLPTGSGKSLCFQLLPRFTAGLTVVIVPTIALALDQQLNAERLFAGMPKVNPLSFASDDDPESTLRAVKAKETRLLFASPEACVSGRLRPILDEFARLESGWLTNLVVDEAHLIETWGAQFRVEFQILSAARRAWRDASGGRLRTFLFSATMSPHCREVLHKLFSDEETPGEFVCQRPRPEIVYYSHRFPAKAARNDAAIQALWQLPRPAILYVTEKADAETLLVRLREEGFRRVVTFHGDTRKGDRKTILRRWKENELDLVVATSAFGVGVDKADVRAVVHACYPENLDRYYQEVGRGGRDGWSCVSLLLAAPEDRETAEGITVKVMRPESIQERWAAMFARAEERGNHLYALPVASRRIQLAGSRTYGENIRWNKRLLLQLERAGHLEFTDLEYRRAASAEDDAEEWAIVRIKSFQPNTPYLSALIKVQREAEVSQFQAGLLKLDEFLAGTKCASRVLRKLYAMPSVECPGCPFCRSQHLVPPECEPLDFPPAIPFGAPFQSEWVEGCPSLHGHAERVRFTEMIARCITSKGLRQFHTPEPGFESVMSCFQEAFPQNTAELHRLDSITPGARLSSAARFPLVFFHLGEISAPALALGRSQPAVHLLCGLRSTPAPGARDAAVDERFRRWPSLEAWLSSSPANSLPCLPTTL
jgi:ATP-dependent DNA helicase RecQ